MINAKGKNNVLVIQSGGPTPVMNQSLAGVVQQANEHNAFGEVYGAVHGIAGVLKGELLDLRKQSRQAWPRIARSPGAALGTGRRNLDPEEIPAVLETLKKLGIKFLFTIGGNDTAETAHLIAGQTAGTDTEITAIHIPKTIDNDLMVTDHCPGFGSAARFVALATMGVGKDAEAMGDACPITVIEVMGRDAGWLAASAVLGKRSAMDAPHFVVVPEVPVDEGHFLDRIEEAYRRWGYAVAVTAENAQSKAGPLGSGREPYYVDDFGHKYYEGPARYLAEIASRVLKVRTRFEEPGTIQRSMMACVSGTDAAEAHLVGKAAVRYAVEGQTDRMVTLIRQPGRRYSCDTGLTPLENIAGQVKVLPQEYFDADAALPTSDYVGYARPLSGGPLPKYPRLLDNQH